MVVSELSISKEETAHIAELARLSLNESELAQAQHDLSEIIDYMNKIAGLNTDGGVALTIQPCPVANVWREDVVLPSLNREEVLANAPDRQGEFFRVPRIIEAEGGQTNEAVRHDHSRACSIASGRRSHIHGDNRVCL